MILNKRTAKKLINRDRQVRALGTTLQCDRVVGNMLLPQCIDLRGVVAFRPNRQSIVYLFKG